MRLLLTCARCGKLVDGKTSELMVARQSWLVTAYCHDGTDQIEVPLEVVQGGQGRTVKIDCFKEAAI